MTAKKPYVTSTGRVLSEEEIEALADEAVAEIAAEPLMTRRRGRPRLEGGPAEVVPVRLDAGLREAVEARATADQTTTSDVIRVAFRRYLEVEATSPERCSRR